MGSSPSSERGHLHAQVARTPALLSHYFSFNLSVFRRDGQLRDRRRCHDVKRSVTHPDGLVCWSVPGSCSGRGHLSERSDRTWCWLRDSDKTYFYWLILELWSVHCTAGLYDKVEPRVASMAMIILIHCLIHFGPINQIHNFTTTSSALCNLNIDIIIYAFVQDWMFKWKRDWHWFRQD